MRRQEFILASVYDTETCNIGNDAKTAHAYPILFIDNDIRDIDIYEYKPDIDDKVHFYRYEQEMQARIDEYIKWGLIVEKVPIICAYNLMFDLQPLMYELSQRYEIRANAQSSTNVYTLDLYEYETDKILLRFWDTFHLEMRGLAAMGKTAGLQKATGDWDYSLVRTPDTPLTEEELYYAKRDVQVIPAYLRYLLHANEWMKQKDFGVRVLTKTSIVRQMARRQIAGLYYNKENGKKITIDKMFLELCRQELPDTYNQYALRKACFRGGYTFTSARWSNTIQYNVVSVDVTSMHHTFINGRMVPDKFHIARPKLLDDCVENVLHTSREKILKRYDKPFDVAFHALIEFRNIRLRKNSVFDRQGIALEPMSKFRKKVVPGTEYGIDDAAIAQEDVIRECGWTDTFKNAVFAFGKLYAADMVRIHVSEIELWCMSRVYEWDSYKSIYGECTASFIRPPDFVTAQSNLLFETKSIAKHITATYKQGVPYSEEISSVIPEGISALLKDGTCEEQFFNEYYTSTVKGMFNGIYGTQAQDVFKPSYTCDKGELTVDRDTITTEKNFEEKKPKSCRVLYTYGLRIVGGSRMHMIISMELINERFGEKIRILGGDTDSMKMACDFGVADDEIESCLNVLLVAAKNGIDSCMERLRHNYPQLSSDLKGIGGFEIENKGAHYQTHIELWNKARVSVTDGKSHVTCAGLPRPLGKYHIENFIDDLIKAGYDTEYVLNNVIGFNTYVGNSISHLLEGKKPHPSDVYEGNVVDYLGKSHYVCAHESNALYDAGRWLGETLKATNDLSVLYVKKTYNRELDTRNKYLDLNDGISELCVDSPAGIVVLMRGKKNV